MSKITPEPDISNGEQPLQEAVKIEINRILKGSGNRFMIVERFGLDVAAWIAIPPRVVCKFIELKVFIGGRRGGVGFGNRLGQGPQVDILMNDASVLALLDDNVRWIIADGTSPIGSERYAILTSEAVKASAMRGVARGKQNNINIRDAITRSVTWPKLCKELETFLLSAEGAQLEHPPGPAPPNARVFIEFTREQLIDPDYNPIGHGDVDAQELERRYPQYPDLHHAAAIRGILVREQGGKAWRWVWGVGLLHDELLAASGYSRLFARYRNQYGMAPRIEFEPGANVASALRLLLQTTPIQGQDLINIEAVNRRASSIDDYFGD
jgi:hypothetical protein